MVFAAAVRGGHGDALRDAGRPRDGADFMESDCSQLLEQHWLFFEKLLLRKHKLQNILFILENDLQIFTV